MEIEQLKFIVEQATGQALEDIQGIDVSPLSEEEARKVAETDGLALILSTGGLRNVKWILASTK